MTQTSRGSTTPEGRFCGWINSRKAAGDFVRLDDGFLAYWPKDAPGAYTEDCLRALADFLESENAEWAADIEAYFAQEREHEDQYDDIPY